MTAEQEARDEAEPTSKLPIDEIYKDAGLSRTYLFGFDRRHPVRNGACRLEVIGNDETERISLRLVRTAWPKKGCYRSNDDESARRERNDLFGVPEANDYYETNCKRD